MTSIEALVEQSIDRFWETVPPLWGMVRSHIRATATGNFDITVEQFHILRFVRRGTESISELAAAKNISRPAVSQAVDVLVNKGLVTRIQSATDRRFVELALTPKGNELLDAVFSEMRAWMRERMRSLTPDELAEVVSAMEALKKLMNQAEPC